MAKKAVSNKSEYISDDLMSKFTKINIDNIKEFFDVKSLFVILNEEGSKKSGIKYIIVNQFLTRQRFIKDNKITFSHIFNNVINSNIVKIFTEESIEDYNCYISDLKVLIKGYINKNVLYGIKL